MAILWLHCIFSKVHNVMATCNYVLLVAKVLNAHFMTAEQLLSNLMGQFCDIQYLRKKPT